MKDKIQPLLITLIGLMFLLPIAFLLFKTAPYWAGEKAGRPTISELEELTNAAPTFDNYLNLSVVYLNSRQPEKALAPLEKAKALNPASPIVYNNLGVAYIMLKRYDEGISACRKALELDPSFQLAKNNLNWGLEEKLRNR